MLTPVAEGYPRGSAPNSSRILRNKVPRWTHLCVRQRAVAVAKSTRPFAHGAPGDGLKEEGKEAREGSTDEETLSLLGNRIRAPKRRYNPRTSGPRTESTFSANSPVGEDRKKKCKHLEGVRKKLAEVGLRRREGRQACRAGPRSELRMRVEIEPASGRDREGRKERAARAILDLV